MSELISNTALVFLGGMFCGTVFTYMISKMFTCSGISCNGNMEYDIAPNRNYGTNKLVLVIRNDLKMGKGKVAAQCSHAAVLAHELSRKKAPVLFADWKRNGQPKIIVKVDNEKEMLQLAEEARKNQLLVSIVQDAGRTQVPKGSKTVLAIGPGPESSIDQITGYLKLY